MEELKVIKIKDKTFKYFLVSYEETFACTNFSQNENRRKSKFLS